MSTDQIRHELESKRVDELRQIARNLQVPSSSATKADLITRLLNSDVEALTNQLTSAIPPKSIKGMPHKPERWERICVNLMALIIVVLISYLIIRNEPFKDPNLVVFTRIILSTAVGVFGIALPGFLNVDLSFRGMTIRASGALALVVVSLYFTPKVLRSEDLDTPPEKSSMSYSQALIQVMDENEKASSWQNIKTELVKKQVTWTGLVVVSKSTGYVIEANPKSDKNSRAYISLKLDGKYIPKMPEDTLTIRAVVTDINERGIILAGGEAIK